MLIWPSALWQIFFMGAKKSKIYRRRLPIPNLLAKIGFSDLRQKGYIERSLPAGSSGFGRDHLKSLLSTAYFFVAEINAFVRLARSQHYWFTYKNDCVII